MRWRHEETREIYISGGVTVGAVYPPPQPGMRWRWRCWVNGRHVASSGSLVSEALARRAVESVFSNFLNNADLVSVESEAE